MMLSGKLCVSVEVVQRGVEGLVFLLMESSKHMVGAESHSVQQQTNKNQKRSGTFSSSIFTCFFLSTSQEVRHKIGIKNYSFVEKNMLKYASL